MNFIDKTISKLPYVKSMFGSEDTQNINKKYNIFEDASITKEKRIQRLSITNEFDFSQEWDTNGGNIPNQYYHQLMYNSSSDDKKRRLEDFRIMSQYPEVESALREICNEMFELDDNGEIFKFNLKGDYNEEVKETIKKEFYSFIKIFKFNEKGFKYIWDFIVEAELFFENIVSGKNPELGIIGVTRIASERIDPLYYDIDNELVDSFILREKIPDSYPYQWGKFSAQAAYGSQKNEKKMIFLNDKQVTYFYNDKWEQEKKYRLPILSTAQRPYRQLSLIEDATVIYMLVRAPERLVFNIDTGNLPPPKAGQYMKRMMSQFWSKKNIANDGRIENVYDPQSMVENYWFAKPKDGQGSTVTSIGGGKASPDNLEILNYFVQKLYKSLNVPLSRLNSETAFSDGESITREELRFAEFIIGIQKIWAATIKNAFIVHLKLKGKKLVDAAEKLKITSFNGNPSNEKNLSQKLEVSDIFKDTFSFETWENYDYLYEEIINRLEYKQTVLKEKYITRLQSIDEKIKKIEHTLLNESNQLILESGRNNISILEEEAYRISQNIQFIDLEKEEITNDIQSWWDQYEIKDEDIEIKLNEPSQFFQLRQQQLFQMKMDNYNNMTSSDFISNTYAQKKYLGWSDDEILLNRELLKKDAAARWELSNIEQNGPDFREKALEEMEAVSSDLGGLPGLGGGGGGLPGGDTSLPDFGEPIGNENPSDSGTESPSGESPEGGGEGGGEPPLPPS